MSFVAENGTGLANANSFVTQEAADAYFEDRANTIWAAAGDDPKLAALVRATDYINNRFVFKGSKFVDTQALEFPRTYIGIAGAQMPEKLKRATYEYALRALNAALAPDPVMDDRGLLVQSKTEKVGPLEESTTYKDGGQLQIFRAYPEADMLLRDLVMKSNRVVR